MRAVPGRNATGERFGTARPRTHEKRAVLVTPPESLILETQTK